MVSFSNIFCEDSAKHVLEGVAILPGLVASMDNKPEHIIFVGNTSDEHVETILKYGRDYPDQCWMAYLGYSEEKIRAFANYVKHFSQHFKDEAENYGFKYIEMTDEGFEDRLKEGITYLTHA